MKKTFSGTKEDIVKEIEEWLDYTINKYDRVEIILELLDNKDD